MPAPPLQICTTRENGVMVIKLDGTVEASTMDILRRTVEPLCRQPGSRIVVDGTLLSYVNSLGFGFFFKLSQHCREQQGRLILAGLQPKLRAIFQVLGLEKLLTFAPTCEEALASLAGSGES